MQGPVAPSELSYSSLYAQESKAVAALKQVGPEILPKTAPLPQSRSLPSTASPLLVPKMPPVPLAAIKAMTGLSPRGTTPPKDSISRQPSNLHHPAIARVKTPPPLFPAPGSGAPQQGVVSARLVARSRTPPSLQGAASRRNSARLHCHSAEAPNTVVTAQDLQLARIRTTSEEGLCIKIPKRFAHKPSASPPPTPSRRYGAPSTDGTFDQLVDASLSHRGNHQPCCSAAAAAQPGPHRIPKVGNSRATYPDSPSTSPKLLSQDPIHVIQQARSLELGAGEQRTTVLPQLKTGRNSAGRLPQWNMHAASVQPQGKVTAAFAQPRLGAKTALNHVAAGRGKEVSTQAAGNSTLDFHLK